MIATLREYLLIGGRFAVLYPELFMLSFLGRLLLATILGPVYNFLGRVVNFLGRLLILKSFK